MKWRHDMDRLPAAIVVIALLVLFLVLMLVSWRSRKRRQSGLDEPASVPVEPGHPLASIDGLYLSTTPVGDRLNRIAVRGLGFRARLRVVVTESGVILPIPGEREIFIPRSSISSVSSASWTIDRGIEPGGLSVIGWSLGGQELESFFRFDDPQPFIDAVSQLVDEPATTTSTRESESQ
jgi:hypothetical protein